MALLVVGFIIFAISGSTPKVAPVAAPVEPKHIVKKHKRKHAAHRAPATAARDDVRVRL
jgi:hypothetical protein